MDEDETFGEIFIHTPLAELKLSVLNNPIQDETRHDETIVVLYK